MGNPWMDVEKARAWSPTGKPGQVHREDALGVVFTLLDVHTPQRILDLGCGIGDIDARLLERYPSADLVALDGAPGMVERARERLAEFGPRATVLEATLESAWDEAIDPGFDVVMASQVVHHLLPPAKRALFARVFGVLHAGGLFVLNDKVRFDERFFPHHLALWNATRIKHGFETIRPSRTYDDYLVREQEGGDVPSRLATQLIWLHEAGFVNAESFWQHGDQAVFAGIKE